ncbi:MAG: hypothetical protein Q8K77_06440, partial [Thermodesulfovibrionales bacterium]|nr:hypothetical protein [Thermodesulfovibrionales bacterium]
MEIGECKSTKSFWRGIIEEYREFLPVSNETPVITLNEGDTPLIKAANINKRGIDLDIYFK